MGTLAAAWAPTIVSVLTMIFVAGKTYGRINGQEQTLKRHDDTLIDHDGRLESLEVKAQIDLARREGVKEGMARLQHPQGNR